MSGIQMILMAGAGTVTDPISYNISRTQTGGTGSAGMSWLQDGSTLLDAGTSGSISPWYQPVGGVPGNQYWIKATQASGTAPSAGQALGTYFQLSSAVGWSWTRSTTGITSAVLNIFISNTNSDAGIVASGTLTSSVQIN